MKAFIQTKRGIKTYLDDNSLWKIVDEFFGEGIKDRQKIQQLIPEELKSRLKESSAAFKSQKKEHRKGRITFKITLGYHGTQYCGWAWHPSQKTVEDAVQKALARLFEKTMLNCSGRTDKGVHAIGQVCSFYSWDDIDDEDILTVIRAMDPSSLCAYNISRMPREFHATFSCKWRYYLYILPKVLKPNESDVGKINVESVTLNAQKLADILQHLQGKDLSFNAFARDTPAGKNSTCYLYYCNAQEEIMSINGKEKHEVVCIHLVGDRFLRRMVRVIVSTLVREAMLQSLDPEHFEEQVMLQIAEKGDRGLSAPPAPSCGLCFMDAGYSSWATA